MLFNVVQNIITHSDIRYLVGQGKFKLGKTLVANASGLFLTWFLANNVSRDVFGNYKLVLSMLALFAVFALPGLRDSILQSVASGHDSSVVAGTRYAFRYSLLGSMGLMACALYFHLQGVPQAAKAFLIAALFFPVIYTARNYYLYLTAHQRFKEEFVCQSFVELGTVLAVAVAVLFLDANLLYIVLLMLGFQAASYTYLFYRFTRDIGSDETDEELIEYGWFLTAFEGLLHISHYIDRCSIGLFLSPGALAMYSIAKLPHSAPRRLSRTVFNVFFPRFAANEEGLSTKKVLFVLGGSALVMIAVVLVLPFAMGVLFPTYQEAVLYGQLLSLTILPVPLNALFGYYFRAKKRRRAIRLALGASGGLSILFTLPALYFAGVMGIVVVQLSREFLVFGCYMLCFFGERGGVRHAPQG